MDETKMDSFFLSGSLRRRGLNLLLDTGDLMEKYAIIKQLDSDEDSI